MHLLARSWHHCRGRAVNDIPQASSANVNPYSLPHYSIPAGLSVSPKTGAARRHGIVTRGKVAMTGCTRLPSRRVHCAITTASNDTNTTQPSEQAWVTMSAEVLQCLEAAHKDAVAAGFTATEPSHIMLACLQHDYCTALRTEIEGFGTSIQEVRATMHVGLLIHQQLCSFNKSAVVTTYRLSTTSEQLLRTIMECVLQQGRPIV
jgi:hypothetical protein